MRAVILGVAGAASIVAARYTSLPNDHPAHDVPVPRRPLEWGDVNVLHTTDIHGWISGHKKKVYPELSWSGDFGNFDSFVIRMREIADQRDSDLLLVDTGDRRIGHGLTDYVLDPETSVNGQAVSLLYRDIGYDLVVPGNHDLQNANVTRWTKETLVGLWGDKYLTSNIYRTDGKDPEERKPLGVRFRYWESPKKKNIMAFGVVTNKTRLAKEANLKVMPINEMVGQEWFKNAIKPNSTRPVDVFVLLGHVDPKQPKPEDDIELIYHAIRQEHRFTPILIFAGHTHQRWCRTIQSEKDATRSMLLQSGRYFDTVGWMSVKLDNNTVPQNLTFSRRYLDNNVDTYAYHTGVNKTEFHTKHGENITETVKKLGGAEHLTNAFGWLDSDYYLDRQKWSEDEQDKKSLFSFYLNAVQTSLVQRNSNRSSNWLFFSNWGILRGDIYRGPFTMSDLYAISPDDKTPFLYVNVGPDVADQLMRKTQEIERAKKSKLNQVQGSQPETVDFITDSSQSHLSLLTRRSSGLTYGWKTQDLCGPNGDDINHEPIPRVDFDNPADGLPVYFWRKNYRSSELEPNATVDVIVTNYIGNGTVSQALKQLGLKVALKPYREDVRQDNLLIKYIKTKFPYTAPGKTHP